MYLVKDAMTVAPITVFPDDDLARAAFLMKRGRLRHLPVVQHGKLLGLLSQRELLAALGPNPGESAETTRVREVMVSEVVTTTETTPLRKAARVLWDRKFGCLPVLDDTGALVGILTETDFIRFAAEIAADFDRVETSTRALPPPEGRG
ncbi:MAG: CBS domain-containing protein [Archangiaceae bacterium]|nr:CBS domain-containing protein [Archangiaceae bacterium]